MAKELTHRSDDLKELGWSQEDVVKYEELWDYRQRWGSINLERDDRQFLRKAEAALPKIVSGKVSNKKPTHEKSYYLWLSFYVDQMLQAENLLKVKRGSIGAWRILLEEEMRVLDYFEPVLGLPDTIKAKALFSVREEIITKALEKFQDNTNIHEFDFQKPLDEIKAKEGKSSWKPLREGDNSKNNQYLVLNESSAIIFRKEVRDDLPRLISSMLPSLKDTDKPLPPDNWSRE